MISLITEDRIEHIENRTLERIKEMQKDARRGTLPPILLEQLQNLERKYRHIQVLEVAQQDNLTTAQ